MAEVVQDNNIIDCLLDRQLFHVVEHIFLHLDSDALFNAERASPKRWSRFIQGNRKLYYKKLATISDWLLINVTHREGRRKNLRSLGTIPYVIDERDQ